MIVRPESPEDIPSVRSVIESAFDQADEADLVEALRVSGDTVLSLIAEDAGIIAGHIAFSKLYAPLKCLALAPVSVRPQSQKLGVGSRLINEGLAQATRDGWHGVFVLGDPAYYRRFGFTTAAAEPFDTEYPKAYFMALELQPGSLTGGSGTVVYAPPFLALE